MKGVRSDMSLVLLLFVAELICSALTARRSSIDVESDFGFTWKIKGNYLYLPFGKQLLEFRHRLPEDFQFKTLSDAIGVWAIFPTLEPVSTDNNVTQWTNKVTISFSSSAQLMDSVTIHHNSGGHPIINVIVNGHNFTQTPEFMFSGWIDIGFPLEGKSKFSIELIATGEHDYILIDRIEATYLESPTTSQRPRTTTMRPEPLSKASMMNPVDASIVGLSLLIPCLVTKLYM